MHGSEQSEKNHGIEPSEPDHNIDWFIFISTAVIIIGVCVPLILFPEEGNPIFSLVKTLKAPWNKDKIGLFQSFHFRKNTRGLGVLGIRRIRFYVS